MCENRQRISVSRFKVNLLPKRMIPVQVRVGSPTQIKPTATPLVASNYRNLPLHNLGLPQFTLKFRGKIRGSLPGFTFIYRPLIDSIVSKIRQNKKASLEVRHG